MMQGSIRGGLSAACNFTPQPFLCKSITYSSGYVVRELLRRGESADNICNNIRAC